MLAGSNGTANGRPGLEEEPRWLRGCRRHWGTRCLCRPHVVAEQLSVRLELRLALPFVDSRHLLQVEHLRRGPGL